MYQKKKKRKLKNFNLCFRHTLLNCVRNKVSQYNQSYVIHPDTCPLLAKGNGVKIVEKISPEMKRVMVISKKSTESVD